VESKSGKWSLSQPQAQREGGEKGKIGKVSEGGEGGKKEGKVGLVVNRFA